MTPEQQQLSQIFDAVARASADPGREHTVLSPADRAALAAKAAKLREQADRLEGQA
jgi:hypothetical protein